MQLSAARWRPGPGLVAGITVVTTVDVSRTSRPVGASLTYLNAEMRRLQ